MSEALAGKTAIVCGADTRVGAAIARCFAGAGARLMLAGAEEAALGSLAESLAGDGAEVARFHLDTRDRLGAANLVAATLDSLGSIDILVADLPDPAPAEVLEMPAGALDAALAGTVGGLFLLAQAAARKMAARAAEEEAFSGAIVAVLPAAGPRSGPRLLPGAVAGAAAEQLTRSLALALAPHRVRVNALALGPVMTERLRAALAEDEARHDEVLRLTPAGRIGETEEAAAAALFLASDQASFITGQVVAVDGGSTALDPLAELLG